MPVFSFGRHADRDVVRILDEFPQMNVGAPCPLMLADENRLAVAYYLQIAPSSPADQATLHVVDPTKSLLSAALVKIKGCLAVRSGHPNDEALHGHRLYPRGLHAYAVSEVHQSSWIDEIDQANSVHHEHVPGHFKSKRHIIFTFHDSTLEVLCDSFEYEVHHETVFGLLPLMEEFLKR
ncbi:MAG: hypothetical protein GC182_12700 [Rhodopseudomonas sp.]|nr:hypothetical protein [Rhodopseudomonas sp.]